MSRWQSHSTKIELQPGHSWYAYASDESCADNIVNAHNADIDAYETRIAELEAERDELQQKITELKQALLDADAYNGDAEAAQFVANLYKRRLDAVVEALEPGPEPKEPNPSASTWQLQSASIIRKLYIQKNDLYARIKAIAEGRDDE